MTNKTWSRKFVAVLVAAAVLTVYSMLTLATPAARSGELSVNGEVTVNGQKFVSGGTIFSGSVIATSKNSSATASLSKLGRVELLANSNLTLGFADNAIMGALDSGRARVSTPAGVSVNITTKDGLVVVDGSQAASFVVSTEKGNTIVTTEAGSVELRSGKTTTRVGAGETGTAGVPQPSKSDDDEHGIHGNALLALLVATGGAVAAIIWATTHNNDLNFGGTVIVVSPTK